MREITARRVTAPAMPVTIEERRAFLRATRQRGKRLPGVLLLRSVFLLPVRLLLLRIGRLVGLPRTDRRKQKQGCDSNEVMTGHSVSPGPHDFRFFMYS